MQAAAPGRGVPHRRRTRYAEAELEDIADALAATPAAARATPSRAPTLSAVRCFILDAVCGGQRRMVAKSSRPTGRRVAIPVALAYGRRYGPRPSSTAFTPSARGEALKALRSAIEAEPPAG
jgi:hypothetical protein